MITKETQMQDNVLEINIWFKYMICAVGPDTKILGDYWNSKSLYVYIGVILENNTFCTTIFLNFYYSEKQRYHSRFFFSSSYMLERKMKKKSLIRKSNVKWNQLEKLFNFVCVVFNQGFVPNRHEINCS